MWGTETSAESCNATSSWLPSKWAGFYYLPSELSINNINMSYVPFIISERHFYATFYLSWLIGKGGERDGKKLVDSAMSNCEPV